MSPITPSCKDLAVLYEAWGELHRRDLLDAGDTFDVSKQFLIKVPAISSPDNLFPAMADSNGAYLFFTEDEDNTINITLSYTPTEHRGKGHHYIDVAYKTLRGYAQQKNFDTIIGWVNVNNAAMIKAAERQGRKAKFTIYRDHLK